MVQFITKLCKNLEKIDIYPYKFLLDPPFLCVTFNTPVRKELEYNFCQNNNRNNNLKYKQCHD